MILKIKRATDPTKLKQNKKKTTPRYNIVKLLKVEGKQKTLNAARAGPGAGGRLIHKESVIRTTADFPSEIIESPNNGVTLLKTMD